MAGTSYMESTKVPGGTWLQPVQSIPNLVLVVGCMDHNYARLVQLYPNRKKKFGLMCRPTGRAAWPIGHALPIATPPPRPAARYDGRGRPSALRHALLPAAAAPGRRRRRTVAAAAGSTRS
eukprot:SAG31_NODE_19828_length_590_cov_2.148676_1_plen_121_part_00